MNAEVFITCAVTGAGATADKSELVPVTPEEIAGVVDAVVGSPAALPDIPDETTLIYDLTHPVFPEALPLEGLAEFFPIAVTVGIASLGTGAIVRGGLSPTNSMVFTNVRLIPCYAAETVHRIVPAITGAAGGGGGIPKSPVPRARAEVGGGSSTGIVDVIREGFDRSVGRVPVEDGGSLGDGRLLARLGVVLGTIYLAFLTIWFWATRLRWNRRDLA